MQKNVIGQHLLQCCGFHSAMSKAHAACAKECEDSAQQTFHKSAAEVHLSMAEHFVKMGRALRNEPDDLNDDDELKAARTADLNKLQPTQVRGVMPTDVPGVRLVNRFGGPPIEATPNVPAEFADLVKTD